MDIKYCEQQTNPAKLKQTFKPEEFPILSTYQTLNDLFDYWEYGISIPKYTDNYNLGEKFTEIKKFINNILLFFMVVKYFRQVNFDLTKNFINICKIIQKN